MAAENAPSARTLETYFFLWAMKEQVPCRSAYWQIATQ